jgi:hypothetical protein
MTTGCGSCDEGSNLVLTAPPCGDQVTERTIFFVYNETCLWVHGSLLQDRVFNVVVVCCDGGEV